VMNLVLSPAIGKNAVAFPKACPRDFISPPGAQSLRLRLADGHIQRHRPAEHRRIAPETIQGGLHNMGMAIQAAIWCMNFDMPERA
jgi:hypothetical protein